MSDLPSGTVTFLFSDIEGSTALLRRLRDRYGEVLADHHRLLRTAFSEAGGTEIDSQGDAFFFCFRKARDAVRAAVAGQRALDAHEWPEDTTVRVRMGIHTGEASLTDDRYHGLAVHRAKRICDAGHGGQILISQTSYSLLEDEEEEHEGILLRELGRQRLKDFDRPVDIFQLVATDLASEFPPLRTLDTEPVETVGERLRILIADDQALVRAGFRMILDAEPDVEVVGEAASGSEAIEEVRRLLADGGVGSKVVMLTTFDMDEYVYEALRAGASGFLLKDVPPEQLVEGIRAVASGDALLAPSITRRVIEEFVSRPPGAT